MTKPFKDNGTICPLLFNGLFINTWGKVTSCCVSTSFYGDSRFEDMSGIMNNDKHKAIKQDSLSGIKNPACQYCWDLESNPNTKDHSNRIHALKYYEDWMDNADAFKIGYLDLRWQNTCSSACIMCNGIYSSKWAKELNQKFQYPFELTEEMLNYVYSNTQDVTAIYLAGGEPLQMTENSKLLEHFLEVNPNVNIRVNTSLATLNTDVYRILKKFNPENIHWTVSVDGDLDMFEYVRYPGNWKNFYHNLLELQHDYDNIDYGILVNVLNYQNVLTLVDHVLIGDINADPNTIKLSALTYPPELDIRNHTEEHLNTIVKEYEDFIFDNGSEHMLGASAFGIIDHIKNNDFTKDLDKTREFLLQLDKRRNLDYRDLGTYVNESI